MRTPPKPQGYGRVLLISAAPGHLPVQEPFCDAATASMDFRELFGNNATASPFARQAFAFLPLGVCASCFSACAIAFPFVLPRCFVWRLPAVAIPLVTPWRLAWLRQGVSSGALTENGCVHGVFFDYAVANLFLSAVASTFFRRRPFSFPNT